VDRVVTGLRLTASAAAARALPASELVARARRLRLVLTDCDGVLTDGTVYVSEHGEALKRFSLRDGLGVERLREAGIAVAIVTRERSPIVVRRAEKLRLPFHFEGVQDKRAELPRILAEAGRRGDEVAYIGDDLNDLEVLREVGERGLTAAPADACDEVARAAHFNCRARGGDGAFREFGEWLLRLRGAGLASQPQAEQRGKA
jgi:3-deoxy-D-manno-octulosonate 8-phosphate phosphatase (KDO 8-P phosphatase)